MGITSKYLTLVLKALLLGAIIAGFGLSSVNAKERQNTTAKAVRMNLWYLGVQGKYELPEEQFIQEAPREVEKKHAKQWPEELTRALKKENFL